MGYCATLVQSEFFVATEHTGRVLRKLENYGYSPSLDDDGNIVEIDFIADKLRYDENTMFQAVAPYVKDGSFIEMRGEDGTLWRWVFADKKCKEVKAEVTWPDE
jgi:hypothetical protein